MYNNKKMKNNKCFLKISMHPFNISNDSEDNDHFSSISKYSNTKARFC